MSRLTGRVHVSGSYPLPSLSAAEWTIEERDRYLAEITRDLAQAAGSLGADLPRLCIRCDVHHVKTVGARLHHDAARAWCG
ncbi:MAG TPA: hypothetical protein VFL86_27110 [Burkholderiaceae bacterium]|nr:hypothetical protein [Burkholderiaceae bacterium]